MEAAGNTGVGVVATSVPPPAAQAVNAPAWLELPLVDARTGATFTLADFSGKTVLARGIAQWCTNCRNGQMRWRDEVLTQVNADNVVFVSIDVETNSSAASLASYADGNNFSWVFAVATPELLQALSAQFGSTVLVPPSEPQWVIRPDGSVSALLSDRSSSNLISLLSGASS
jgi:thiol-disulfide isomerase/thioredoxin